MTKEELETEEQIMFEKDIKEEAEKRCSKYFQENCYKENRWADTHDLVAMYLDGYSKANEWFDATERIPVPKNLKINRHSAEVISSEGDLVCYDYQNKEWNKIILEDDKVSYVPVEIREWTSKPKKN